MRARSAGILMHKRAGGEIFVLLVHPGGPFWRSKDLGAWSIPKGEIVEGESAEQAARREFEEELGSPPPAGLLRPLGEVRQRGGKTVEAFALESDFDATLLRSNMFEMEWPPRSGRMQAFPEVDRVAWFALPAAREKILLSQRPLLERL